MRAHGVEAVRAAEARVLASVPEGALMQRAAAGVATAGAQVLRRRRGRVTGTRVAVLAGAGNNGGDALWAGARLAARGARVDALLLSGTVHAQGLAALRAAGGRSLAVPAGETDALAAATSVLVGADLVIDGIVGLGASPGLREPAATLVAVIDGLDPRPAVLAVDLPSGVHPDDGTTPGAYLRADLTVTFGTAKPCLLLPPAARAAGQIRLVDLGLAPHLPPVPAIERITGAAAAALWPVPGPDDDKYSRGVVGVVAGSRAYPGAAVLATGGALRAGAGMVRYVGSDHPTEQVRARWPEVVTGPGRVQAWTLGSGVDPDDADDPGERAVRAALEQRLPTVVDAGALALLARPSWRDLSGEHLLLTPHAGELARLLSTWTDGGEEPARAQVGAAPWRYARRVAELTGATVLLKGSVTVIVAPDGRCRTQADAPGWLATAGAGDVLAGIVGTLLAAGLAPLDAGPLGALVHGRAAARAAAGGPIVADDVAAAVPGTVADLLQEWPVRR